jgi:hypothetical protein
MTLARDLLVSILAGAVVGWLLVNLTLGGL